MNMQAIKLQSAGVFPQRVGGVMRSGEPRTSWRGPGGRGAAAKASWKAWGCLAGVCLFAWGGAGQGIPEPDLVMYGAVLNVTNNANLRLGYGTLTWVFQPLGPGPAITATGTLTNINNQFSYILRIRCETQVPGYTNSPNTIQLSGTPIAYDRSQVFWNSNALAFAKPSLAGTTFSATDRGRIERVDLTVSLPIVIDVNGLPVDWELTHFGRTGTDPNADPDGDGMSNLAEYRAGTDPNDSTSAFRFTEIAPDQGGIRLKWESANYKTYALQRSPNPSGSYLDIQTGIAATAPTNTWLDATVLGPGPYYYRLRLDDALSGQTVRFVGIRSDPQGGIRLDWLSAPGQLYALQWSSNLTAGFADLVTNIGATPPTNSFRDAGATSGGPYFYRLRLEP